MSNLDVLTQLRDGWDGPKSLAPLPSVLDSFRRFADAVGAPPEIAAKDDGGICLEWDRGATSYTAHLEADGKMWFCLLAENEADDRDREFDRVDIPALIEFFKSGSIGSTPDAPAQTF